MYHKFEKNLIPITKCILLLFWLNNCYPIGGIGRVSGELIQKTHVVTTESSEPIVLDCEFDAKDYNSTLVVKWLKDEKTIYQWIKGHKPTVYSTSKGTIDEGYEISSNSNYKHRAISFPVPTKELSGVYKCLVELMDSTQSIQTYLQVIDVSQSNMQIHYMALPNDTLVTCAVENVYPEPKLMLWSSDDITLSKISERVGPQNNGFYNATVVVSANVIDADDEIGCTLHFPGMEFNVTKVLKSSSSIQKTTAVGIIFMLMVATFA